MTKENIKLFSEMHAEPQWLQDLRQRAFDKIDDLELPVIERVKFHRWILAMERSQKVSHSLLCQTSLRLTIN